LFPFEYRVALVPAASAHAYQRGVSLVLAGRLAAPVFQEFIPKEVQTVLEEHRARMLASTRAPAGKG
jgi:hypothetical protein